MDTTSLNEGVKTQVNIEIAVQQSQQEQQTSQEPPKESSQEEPPKYSSPQETPKEQTQPTEGTVQTSNETNKTTNNGQTGEYVPAYLVLSRAEKKLIYIGLCMGMFLSALDQMIVTVALPEITVELDGEDYFSWVISAYLLTSSAIMPLYGKYSDIYGRRLTYEFSLLWFFIGSVLCGAATDIFFLIIARAIQGIGGGGLQALSMVLIGDIAKPAVRAKYMSSISGIFGLATVFGPLLGGIFTDYVSWRWIFYINAPFILVTAVVCWKILGKIKNAEKSIPIDIIGSLLIFISTVLLVLVVTWGGDQYEWDSAIIIILLILSIILYAGFIYQELRHPEPILNIRLLKIVNFGVPCLVMFFFGMAMLGAFAFLPFYFQYIKGDSAIISGFKIVPMVFGVMLCSIGVGIYISRTGKYILFPTLGAAIFSAGTGLLILLDQKSNYNIEWLYLFVIGCGMGTSFPVYTSIVQSSVPPKDMASSVAAIQFIRSIGGSIGVAIFATILNNEIDKYSDTAAFDPYAYCKGLQAVFLAALICALISFLFAFGIKNVNIFTRQPKPSTTTNNGNETKTQPEGEIVMAHAL